MELTKGIRISYVVPAFNAEDYLSMCLDSLLSQSLDESEFEILVINDGSTDSTPLIAAAYAERFVSIKLITQVNKGLAETRNIGLMNASGRYIWFIDADDYVIDNCTIDLLNFAENNDLDMFLVAPAIKVTSDFKVDFNKYFPSKILKGKLLLESGKVDVGAWAYLYKRSFIESNNLQFLSGYLFEDSEFTPRALFYAKRVGVLDFSVYHYIQHPNSIMGTFSPNRLQHYVKVAEAIEKFRKEHVGDVIVQRFFSSAIAGFVLAGFNAIAAHNLSSQYLADYVDECRSSNLLPLKQVEPGFARLVANTWASKFPALYVKALRGKRLFSAVVG